MHNIKKKKKYMRAHTWPPPLSGAPCLCRDMAFMLSDLARAAGEIQDSLGGQDAELRAARERAVRQSADVRMIREELAVIEQRAGQWQPEPANPPPRARAGTVAARTAGCCPTTRPTRRCSAAGSGSPPSWRACSPGPGSSWSPAPRAPARPRCCGPAWCPRWPGACRCPGRRRWPVVSLTVTARPLTDLAAGLAALDGRDPAAIRQRLADAPGQAHLLIRELTGSEVTPPG